ncbi:MAG: AAA family ATPase [Actinomycetota bacterium]
MTPESVAVRKTVTALFCDLVGSTAFGEKVDPEAARESMNRYFAMARTAIEDNGGTVAKFVGDGVMALWGVPEVAEDDAAQAVRAGLDLQEAFTGIRDYIRDRHGVALGLRVGINTGEVVISDADDDVVGDPLNTAARLEAACTPGRVLVGEPTWRLSRGSVEYSDHGVIQAKGKEEPVAAYEVVGFLEVEDPHTETPFVGREAELRRLQVVMDEAILERSSRLVTVIGAPGVGKTRLAREMREAVEGGTRAFELRCEREGMATFAPVADLLRSAAGITDAHAVDEMRDRLRSLVEPLEDADRVADLLAGFVGAAPMQSTEELFLAVRRLFEVLGATQPVVLVVDDIQWAEPLFLDLLEHLAEWVRGVPLVVVCLARPEIRDVRPPITEVGRRVSAVVALEGLDTEATHELAARLVGADVLPADLLAKIPESTQGNPLFVRELMRMLVDDGVIAERGGSWEMVIDVDAVEVPPTVNTLLASRVERLPVDERRALELASVVGSDFPLGAVAAAAGDATDLDATFDHLRRKELIDPTGAYWGDEPVFRFHHVLIRDAAYRRLLKGNRAELHVTIGDWTERSAADLVGEHEVTIAHHFEQAHQLRLQLGIDDDETQALGGRAAALLRTAAERALEREDLAAAGPLAARALSCVHDDAEGVADLLLVACEALLGTGNVAQGTAAVDRLGTIADDDRRLQAWVACFRAEISIYTDPGGLQGVIESAGQAADVLAELDDQAGVAKARLQRAAALVRLGRVGDCEAELDAALTAARAADDRRRVTAVLGNAPIAALWGPSPVPRAGGRCLDVVRLLRITTGSPAVEATSIRCQAVLESLRGRHDTARTMLETARSTLEEIGHDHGLMETAKFAGLVELLAGDPAAAEPHLQAAHDGLGRLGIGADAGQAAAYLARALMLQGRLEEAEDYALQSDALAGQNPQTAIVSRSVQAEIQARRGEYDEALTLAAEAVHLAAGTDILVDHANAVAAQARVREAAGDAAGAAEAAATAAALYEEKGATVDVGVADDDRFTHVAVHDADAPEQPTAELDRLHADLEGPEWMVTFEKMRVAHEHMTAGRVDDWAAMLSDDFAWVEHRQGVRLEAVGREEARQTLQTILHEPDPDEEPPATPRRVDEQPSRLEMTPLAGRGRNLALARVLTTGGGTSQFEREYLLLGQIDHDDLGVLAMAFDVDDVAAATAELDRLAATAGPTAARRTAVEAEAARDLQTGPPPQRPYRPDNLATAAAQRLCDAVRNEGPELRDLVAEDLDLEAEPHLFDVAGRLPIAIRGESLAMFEATGADGARSWSVEEFDDRGRLVAWSLFGFRDMVEAADHLDDRWHAIASDVPEPDRLGFALTRARRRRDMAALGELLSEDFRFIDHRPFGLPTLDRSQLLAAIEASGSDGTIISVEPAASSDSVVLSYLLVLDEEQGQLIERGPAIGLVACRDGQITANEFFAEDDLDGAMARFDELESRAKPARRSGLDADLRTLEVENAATGRWRAEGRPFVEMAAVRHDHLAIVEVGDPSAPFLVVELAPDGTLTSTAHPSHPDAEVDLFARAAAHTPDADFGTVIEYAIAVTARDRAELERLLSPSFESRTQSDLGLPDGSRAEWIEYIMSGPEFGLEERQRKMFAYCDRALCTWSHTRTTDATATYDVVGVIAWDDSGITVHEEYSLDRLDEALARYDELAASSTPIAEGRLAWLLEGYEISPEEGRRREMDIAAPDAVVDDRRRMLALEQTLDEYREVYAEDSARLEELELEMLAERGERTFVTKLHGRYVGGFDVEFFVVSRFTTDGLWDAQVYTDTEAEALAALEELEVERDTTTSQSDVVVRAESGSPEVGEPTPNVAARAALARDHALFTEPDEAAWLATLAEDVVADERQGILPRTVHGTAALRREYGEIIRSAIDFEAETTVLAVAGDHVALCRLRVFEPDAPRTDSGAFLDLVNLCRTNADGLIERSITFDAEDLQQAQEELARWAEPDPQERLPLNTAARTALRNNRALFGEPDEETWLATFADDVVVEDRQRIAMRTLHGKEEIVGDYRSISQRATQFGFHVETEILGVRDDNLAITLMRVFEADADGRTDTDVFLDHVAIYRTDGQGLIDRCAMFDVADEHDAWGELGSWWAEQQSEADRLLMSEEVRRQRLYRAREVDAWEATLHPEYTSVDHRRLGFGAQDRSQMTARQFALSDEVSSGVYRAPMAEHLGYGVRIGSVESSLEQDRGSTARLQMVMVFAPDLLNGGTRTHMQFEIEDLDRAHIAARELLEEKRRAVAFTEAVAVGGVASGRARESLELFAEMLSDDFEATLLDGTTRSAADVLSGNVDPVTLGFGHVQRSVLCNINQVGLFVIRSKDAEWFSLEVCSDDRLVSVRQIAIDDPRTALRAFDDAWPMQYTGTELHDTALTGTRFRQAMAARDAVALDALLAKKFVVSDKRNLMYGDLERGAYLEVIAELAALPNPEVVGEALGLSPNGWLWRGHQLIPEEGFGSATNAGVFVIGFDAGQITRLECFDETDLDAALDRFEELTAAPVARSFAEAVGFEWIDRARRGDVDGVMALHPDGGMEISEDTWGSEFDMDEAEYQRVLETVLGDVRSLEPSPIDYRGPRFTAGHVALETSSAEMNWITVAECLPDGRFNRLRMLGSATEAVATLDRWLDEEGRSLDLHNSATIFFEASGETFVEVAAVRGDHVAVIEAEDGFLVVEVDDFGELAIERHDSYADAYEGARAAAPMAETDPAFSAYREGIEAADRQGLKAALSPRFVQEFFGDLDVLPSDRAGAIEFYVSAQEFSVEERIPKHLARSPHAICFLGRVVNDPDERAGVDRINVLAADDTGVTYNGVWPVGMLDDALAKFDELSAGDNSLARLAGARVAAALADGDAEALEACFSNDLAYRNESTLSDLDGDKAQLLENLATMPDYEWETRPVATRDRAEVVHVRGGLPGDYELEYCLLVTVNEAGLIDRWHVRDMRDLRLALADAAEAPPHDRDLALVVATNRFDHDAHRNAFGSLVTRDNRPTSVLDALDADAWIQVQAETVETHPNTALWFDVRASSDEALYVEATRWADPTDDAPTWNHLCVFGRTAGLFTSLDLHDVGQEAEARARFDELALTPNRAADLSFQRTALLEAGDQDGFRRLLHPDYTSISHRNLARKDPMDRDEHLEMLDSFDSVGLQAPPHVELVAVRGDRLALFRVQMTSDDDWTTGALNLHQIDDDGLLVFSAMWDVDQLDEATADLDRRWAEEQAAGD